MTRRAAFVASAVAVLATLLPVLRTTTPATATDGVVLAGAARRDSTWRVGSSAGQYATTRIGEDGVSFDPDRFDPYLLSTRRGASYGIQGREWVRALVVQGADGTRWALVNNDLYIPQDLVNRRVAEILAEWDAAHPQAATGITPENLTVSVSHSHSSPYYSSPSWGVWAFQDVFDLRFFEHIAQQMASAVIEAASDMVPVRVGGATVPFTHTKKHSFGPALADDRTPAGYPQTDVDRDLALVRFDDVSDPESPKPLASWVVFGRHPEDLDGNDLLASEFVNAVETIMDREIGGVTMFSQNDTGTSEDSEDARAQPPHLRQEFSHKEYAQTERAARLIADAAISGWRDVELASTGQPLPDGHRAVPFATDLPVAVNDLRFAPPGYRVLPTVSNCRTENAFRGNPPIPLAGLPTCQYPFGALGQAFEQSPVDPAVTWEELRDLCDDGVVAACVPDNLSVPSYTGLQETVQVHLQAIRLGDIGITVCPCEQWADQSRNIKSRLDHESGNLWYGWDWTANYTDPGWEQGVIYDGKDLPGHGPLTLNDWCLRNADGTWSCRNPQSPSQRITVSEERFLRVKAQIYNDAAGWDRAENMFQAEMEPKELDKVWGNFTHEELPQYAYDMVVTVGMTNDYWGYIASFREYQRGDHYRKSLTGLGPHSSDFLATRLSRMAAELNAPPGTDLVSLGPKDQAYAADYAHEGVRGRALGEAAGAYLAVYETQLPSDAGSPAIVEQPTDIERFDAATVEWIGGDNYTDAPHATVERCVSLDPAACDPDDAADWIPYANGFGEVQVKVDYPAFPAGLPAWRLGQHEWHWRATFEAFDSDIVLPDVQGVRRSQTPNGIYRFAIEGCFRGAAPGQPPDPRCESHEVANRVTPYRLVSDAFRVRRWDGITVEDTRVEPDGTVSFVVGPPYLGPDGETLLPSSSNTDELFDYETASNPIDYPNTYDSPFPFIHGRRNGGGSDEDDVREYDPGTPLDDEVFCFHCSFRPWADTGAVKVARVTIVSATGRKSRVPATYDPASGRWRTSYALQPGERALVARSGIVDTFGEINGQPGATVRR